MCAPHDPPDNLEVVFDVVINLKTARAIGITIPASILAQATQGDRVSGRRWPQMALSCPPSGHPETDAKGPKAALPDWLNQPGGRSLVGDAAARPVDLRKETRP